MLFKTARPVSGFSLVEISIVLAIVGIVLVSTATLIKPLAYNSQVDTTEETMRLILRRLSEFAQRNNRLPCPGNPADTVTFGNERSTGAADSPGVGRCTDNTSILGEGIVPFAALGLSEDEVRDAWGNFITYRVAQTWTINFNDRDGVGPPHPNVSNPATAFNTVQNYCLARGWFDSAGTTNVNPGKALFCCPPAIAADALGNVNAFSIANTDIRVLDKNNAPFFDPDGAAGAIPSTRAAGAANLINTSTIGAIRYNPNTAIGVILVSHGPNEHGAFIKGPDSGGNIRRVNRPDSASPLELENANGTDPTKTPAEHVTFYSLPLNDKAGADYFDDIVMFRTTMQIYSENGVTSCAYPD